MSLRCSSLNHEVKFREPIASTIPSLNKLSENTYEVIRAEVVDLLDNLANHGEQRL